MHDWPAEYGDSAHSPFAAMRLGRLRMIDGASDFFPNTTFICEVIISLSMIYRFGVIKDRMNKITTQCGQTQPYHFPL